MTGKEDCWKGKDDAGPFVAGVPKTIRPTRSLRSLFAQMACCTRCDLARGRTQVVPGVGPRRAEIMLIGEAAGAEEDRLGKPFVGKAGRLLDQLLAGAGIDRGDVFITNVVACRPPRNRAPRSREIAAHAPWLDAQLRIVRPRLVVALGRTALAFFVPKGKVTELRGKVQQVERAGLELRVLPTYHPAALLRNPDLLPDAEADFRRIAGAR